MESLRTDNPKNVWTSGTGAEPVVSKASTPCFVFGGAILNLFLVEEQGPKDVRHQATLCPTWSQQSADKAQVLGPGLLM